MPDPFGMNVRPPGKSAPKKAEPEKLGSFLEFWIKLLASGVYTGYTPVAPGTAGTLFAVLIWYYGNRVPIDPLGKFLILGMAALIAVWICSMATRVFNADEANIIAIDDIIGFLIAASYLTPDTYENEWRLVAVTFVIFRFLDIVKPFPMRQLEHLPSGWGVMADDVAAGIITLLAMALPLTGFWVKVLDLQLKVHAGS